ncbi:zinc finger MYM-type 1-like [Paramuricea clavata]|uniref:Zinc finger MYM-type 1-like n=1 Tax=Paramuricea clavata TaxID=317549 RepID=A0A6S7FYG0_PARCT|nr:zinc finger MYM-type 1-like [Paramuricea clavata]
MSGKFAGIAELLKSQQFHWLIYIHCTAHCLNLMVNDLIKDSNLAVDIMKTLNSLYSFLDIPKVRLAYEAVHQELFPKSQIKHLVQQIEIRWGCKFEAIDLMTDKPQVILATLVKVAKSPDVRDSKHVEQVSVFYHKLISGKYIIALITLRAYLVEMFYLSK